MLWEYTDANLTPPETALIARHAAGRALEFGSGMALGTHALLAARCTEILSIDNEPGFHESCAARLTDPRVTFLLVPLLPNNGWYQKQQIPHPEKGKRYNTVLLDGPAGLAGRSECLPMLHENGYLAPDWQILVTHTGEEVVMAFIRQWLKGFDLHMETLYCPRGMARIYPV